MDTNQNCKRPLISICIPTYNRSTHLENLFRSLKPIKESLLTDIEICVSNNNSSDQTPQVLESWRHQLDLKISNQSSNIGGTLNLIAVTKQATGRWIQLIGDDDAFYPSGFISLTESLRGFNPEAWILVGIANNRGDETLLCELSNGSYSSEKFKTIILQTSLYRYGFIGMHIFSSSWLPIYQKLSFNSTQGWPHLALFLRHLCNAGFVVIQKEVVIEQAAGSPALFWGAQDWARVNMGKMGLFFELKNENKSHWIFLDLLALREIYAARNLKALILWKVLETKDFNSHAVLEYLHHYRTLGAAAPFALLHFMFLMGIWMLPSLILQLILRSVGRKNIIANYLERKRAMTDFDAINRRL